jgi:hypothetical protein
VEMERDEHRQRALLRRHIRSFDLRIHATSPLPTSSAPRTAV